MIIGYARVSTKDQNLNSQLDILKECGCEKIFSDISSGKSFTSRPQLVAMLEFARNGDTIVITKLDRLGRNLKELLEILDIIQKQGVFLKIITQNIDTQSSSGKLMLQIFAMIAEFERETIRERTIIGLKSAKIRGRIGGRPKLLKDSDVTRLKQLYSDNQMTLKELSSLFKIKRSTIYKYVNL